MEEREIELTILDDTGIEELYDYVNNLEMAKTHVICASRGMPIIRLLPEEFDFEYIMNMRKYASLN